MNSFDAAVEASQLEDVDALDMYSYNMALAAAYLGPLHILEIVTRNAMHSALLLHTKRGDWWDSSKLQLVEYQEQTLTDTEDKLDKDLAHRQRTPDDVVAALDFGFWCGLLGKGNAGAPYERILWQPALQRAFPHFHGQRGQLWRRMDAARRFRNRVTQHEPIFKIDAVTQMTEILQLIGFVSPPVAAWVNVRTRLRVIVPNPPGSRTPVRTF